MNSRPTDWAAREPGDLASAPGPVWFHGSPFVLDALRAGSTITPLRHLAEVFATKPTLVAVDDVGRLAHNGTEPGWLYCVCEAVGAMDVTPHPRSTMPASWEWLTQRTLGLLLIGPAKPLAEERPNPRQLAEIEAHLGAATTPLTG